MIRKGLPERAVPRQVDSLFGIDGDTSGQIIEVPLEELHAFQGHPFKVLDDRRMEELTESVRENGIITPATVRERKEGGYELISGHRRKRAAELAGLTAMPVVIREMTDDEATIRMIDANLQREEILPSEKAFAYKMKMDAIRHQGRASAQAGPKLGSAEQIGLEGGDSRNQVKRYIRLTELIPALLELVDRKKLKFNPAVELSYLSLGEQSRLMDAMEETGAVPTMAQSQEIRRLSREGQCGGEQIRAALAPARAAAGKDLTIRREKLRDFFPEDASQEEMEGTVLSLLAGWKEGQTGGDR